MGGMKKEATTRKKTGSKIRWKPDDQVFTDINVPLEWFREAIKRQAVVNAGLLFILRDQKPGGGFENYEYLYQNGISDYVKELVGSEQTLRGCSSGRESAPAATERTSRNIR